MKISRAEKKFLDFCQRHFVIIMVIVATTVALIIRFAMRDFRSGDYNLFLEPWFNEIKEKGLRGIFVGGGVGDYNSPYIVLLWILSKLPFTALFSIKLVSVFFDFGVAIMSAMTVRYLIRKKYKKNDKKYQILPILTYMIVILLPTVICNSALWAQCDSIYVFFVMSSIYLLLNDKYTWSFILLGLAFSFKLQFIFVLPIYLMMYFKNRNFSILNFLWIPIVLIVLSVPALICGLPFSDIFGIYFNQIGEYKSLTLSMLNVYQVFSGSYDFVSLIGYATFILLFSSLFYYVVCCMKKIDNDKVIPLMLLSVLICICFLPSMHERYGYLANILAVLYFVLGYGSVFVPIVLEILALMGYFAFLFGLSLSEYSILGLAPIIIIVYIAKRGIDYKSDYVKINQKSKNQV